MANQQEIITKFQQMRNEQKTLMSKISELEQDMNEHKVVIETLEEVSSDRKCFRMIGGVLVERTVGEILPALVHNRTQLSKLIEKMTEKMVSKGKEINEFREKHGIRIKGEEEAAKPDESKTEASSTGVLVSSKS